jgi:hypothetical protein
MAKQYDGKVKIEGKEVGTYSFTGPADKAELKDYSGGITVNWTLATGQKGTDTFESFDAWLYGAKLKAGAPVRIAAEAGTVKDHKILVAGKTTDLDTLALDKACKLVMGIRSAVAMGLSVGDKNAAKVEHFAKGLLDSGKATETAGVLTPKGNGAPVRK